MPKELSDKAEAKLRKFFAKFDKDNDGTIDTQELKQILEMNGQEITDEDIDHFMKTFDVNKDGRLNFEEFMAWWKTLDV